MSRCRSPTGRLFYSRDSVTVKLLSSIGDCVREELRWLMEVATSHLLDESAVVQ